MHRHFLLYKPFGYISQFVTDVKRKKLLGELFDFPEGTMAIGRLDEESEGLLLLTTDGKISEQVRRSEFEKEYFVQVDGIITEAAVSKLREGVEIGLPNTRYRTKTSSVFELSEAPDVPQRAKKIRDDRHGPTSWISITITEGKNRQVRKMTAAVGFPTLRLIRVRIGAHTINGMQPGDVKELSSI